NRDRIINVLDINIANIYTSQGPIPTHSPAVNEDVSPEAVVVRRQGHYCVLHSFPTRRSSDLFERSSAHPLWTPRADPKPACSKRSEEHTSELQSRRDLVCRLLLEKKSLPTSSHNE